MKQMKTIFPITGLWISIVVAILINSYQLMVIIFDIPPPNEGMGALMSRMPAQIIDLSFNILHSFLLAWGVYAFNIYCIGHWKIRFNLLLRIVLSLLLAYLFNQVFALCYIRLFDIPAEISWAVRMHYRGRGMILTLLMLGLAQIIYLSRRNQEQRVEVERLSAENIRTQYVALKNQIDPHFLFNSLNTLNGLISLDATRAQEYVQRLSAIFRYSLQDKEIVSLAAEAEFAQAYGELMQIRYGSALTLQYDIPEKIMDRKILPFSLQILIENAIKHNVVTPAKPLRIDIFADQAAENIVIKNPIQAKREHEPGEGIGLANLSKRYQLLGYDTLSICEKNGIFSVSVPLIKDSHESNHHRR